MSRDEWLARVAADRPPMSPATIAALRPVLAPVIPRMVAAPAAEAGAAPVRTQPQRSMEGPT